MAIPLEYNPLTKVVPSDPHRLPHIPVEVLYLIAQALPQPSQVFNLARVNKATWEYLQPVLYECEVTYEARLVAHFGDGLTKTPSPPNVDHTDRANGNDGDRSDADKDEQAECSGNCAHGLVTALCEVCGQHIAIEQKHFGEVTGFACIGVILGDLGECFYESRGMTALHWACVQGSSALPVARKVIEAAKAHNPSYIDGRGLRARKFRLEPEHGSSTHLGEIPPPLLTAVAFGHLALCVVLVQAGCNVNLVQTRDIPAVLFDSVQGPLFRIHNSCVPSENDFQPDLQTCQWEDSSLDSPTCKTAGHVALDFSHADILEYLLDSGLDPLMGKEPLIHQAARMCDSSAVRALLDRYPEMARHRWNEVTPLHSLCISTWDDERDNFSPEDDERDNVSPEDLRSVAAYLVQKGASLEAKGRETRSDGPLLTPLQFALEGFTDNGNCKVHSPAALIMVGANWDRCLGWIHELTPSILSHCIWEAISRTENRAGWTSWMLEPQRSSEDALAHAEVIKAIVSNTWGSLSDPAPTQGSERHMQEFLGAFWRLANDNSTETLKDKDAFAIEAVGRLLLSTGIRPGPAYIENWETLIAGNSEGPRADEWAASPWRDLVADLPSAAPALTQ